MCDSPEVEKLKKEIHDLERETRTLNSFQLAVKVIINQAYGAFGSKFFYWKNKAVAASITAQGRNLIHYSIDAVNNYFQNVWHKDTELHKKLGVDTAKIKPITTNKVVYVDTDSNYVDFDSLIQSVEGLNFKSRRESAQFVLDVLNERFEKYLEEAFNAYGKFYNVDNRMVFKMEKICSQAIWVAKKLYAYREIYEDDWENEETHASGLPCTKPSYPKKARESMWRLLDVLLDKNKNLVIETDLVPKLKEEFNMFCKAEPNDICYNQNVSGINKYSILKSEFDLVTEQKTVKNKDGNDVMVDVTYAKNKATGEYHIIETEKGGIQKAEIREEYGDYYLVKGCGSAVKGCLSYNNRLVETGNLKYVKIRAKDKIKMYYLNEDGSQFCFPPGDFDNDVCLPINYREQFFRSVVTPVNQLLTAIGKHELTANFTRAIAYKKPLAKNMKAHGNDLFDFNFYCVNKETCEYYALKKKFNKYALDRNLDITESKLTPKELILEYNDAISKYGNDLVLVAEEELNDYIKKRTDAIEKKKAKQEAKDILEMEVISSDD